MKKNYHTHTYLCRHATGTVDEYVQQGIKQGLITLGFSDHASYPYPGNYRSRFRMSLEETQLYVDMLLEAEKKYVGQININIGYEAEYYPACFEAFLKHVRQYPIDYLILGQHFTNNGYDGIAAGAIGDSEENLKKYVDQVIAGMESGIFSYVAHPDIVNFTGPEGIYEQEMGRMILRAAQLDIPLEFNLLGFREQRRYPTDLFWKMVADEGSRVKTVLGCDAHRAIDVADPVIIQKAEDKLRSLGIVPVEEIEFRPVRGD